MVWTVAPFYIGFLVIYIDPLLNFLLVFGAGFVVTIGILVWLIFVNQYQARSFNLLLMKVDRKPLSHGVSFKDYWSYGGWVQLWIKGDPRTVTDENGITTAWVHLLNGGFVHPFYNPGQKIHWVVLKFRGTWNDLIRYDAGQGSFGGSVVDVTNCCFIWVTEVVSEITFDLVAGRVPSVAGVSGKAQLNMIPALIREEEDQIKKWEPVYWIRRAEGSIDMELAHDEEILRRAQLAAPPAVLGSRPAAVSRTKGQ